MLPYKGDLSNADGVVLKLLAQSHANILEFGVGASTQILREYSTGEMVSVDTSDEWIEITKKHMVLLEITKKVDFVSYETDVAGKWDMVFVDGISKDGKRHEFARKYWDSVKVGGIMVFHDTRSGWGAEYVTKMMAEHFMEIEEVKLNMFDSNMTVFKKCTPVVYENWNFTEKREPHRRARGDFDNEVFEEYKKLKHKLKE